MSSEGLTYYQSRRMNPSEAYGQQSVRVAYGVKGLTTAVKRTLRSIGMPPTHLGLPDGESGHLTLRRHLRPDGSWGNWLPDRSHNAPDGKSFESFKDLDGRTARMIGTASVLGRKDTSLPFFRDTEDYRAYMAAQKEEYGSAAAHQASTAYRIQYAELARWAEVFRKRSMAQAQLFGLTTGSPESAPAGVVEKTGEEVTSEQSQQPQQSPGAAGTSDQQQRGDPHADQRPSGTRRRTAEPSSGTPGTAGADPLPGGQTPSTVAREPGPVETAARQPGGEETVVERDPEPLDAATQEQDDGRSTRTGELEPVVTTSDSRTPPGADTDPRAEQVAVEDSADDESADPTVVATDRGSGRGERTRTGRSKVTIAAPGEAATPQPVPPDHQISPTESLGTGGAKTRFRRNVDAIVLLKRLEEEDRPPTADEQSVLASFTGWGALAQNVFQKGKKIPTDWKKETAELKDLLTKDEYAAARTSVLNAHYTSVGVVRGIYDSLRHMGVVRGLALEPSCGQGNFIGLVPDEMSLSYDAVEKDSISARLATSLYPSASIENTPYEDLSPAYKDYDLVIGNPPFGRDTVYDPKARHLGNLSIHNYFLARSIERLRPGGLMAVVVSRFFLDSKADKARQHVHKSAEFLGSVRLPRTAFRANAGTDVVSDIVFFRRRLPDDKPPADAAWLHSQEVVPKGADTEPFYLSGTYHDHPDRILGKVVQAPHGMFPGSQVTVEDSNQLCVEDNPGLMAKAIASATETFLPSDAYTNPDQKGSNQATRLSKREREILKHRDIGSIFFAEPGLLVQVVQGPRDKQCLDFSHESQNRRARLTAMTRLRDQLRFLLTTERTDSASGGTLRDLRDTLNRSYDDFVTAHGPLHSQTNKRLFRDDPDHPLLLALELDYQEGISQTVARKNGLQPSPPAWRKAEIFTDRVLHPTPPPVTADNITDAFGACMNQNHSVDTKFISSLLADSPDSAELAFQLTDSGLCYHDPSMAGALVPAQKYLSGNLRVKLAAAMDAAESDPRYQVSVEALEAVMPDRLSPGDIEVRLGSPWVPTQHIAAFACHLLDVEEYDIRLVMGAWHTHTPHYVRDLLNYQKWGTLRIPAERLIEKVLNGSPVEVRDKVPSPQDPSKEISVINTEETQVAQIKADEMRKEFADWVWDDPDRSADIVEIYNRKFNAWRPPQYDGSSLTFPGMSSQVKLYAHQRNAVARIMQDGQCLLSHVVGAGKTFSAIAAAMKSKEAGLIRKPMFVVPNHLVEQWAEDFRRLYPDAKVLAMGKRDFVASRRREMLAKIGTGHWDAVIISHSSFGFIKMTSGYEAGFRENAVEKFEEAREALDTMEGASRTVKTIEHRLEAEKAKIKTLQDLPKDNVLAFDELGVDQLIIDESQAFKNLFFTTKRTRVAGIGSTMGSKKALDLFMKVRWLQDRHNGKGLIFLTGTPITNTIAELFTVQRYLQLQDLESLGIEHFDNWVNTFAEVTTSHEMNATGVGYRPVDRISRFFNVPELQRIYRTVTDCLTHEGLLECLHHEGSPTSRIPAHTLNADGHRLPEKVVLDRTPMQDVGMTELLARYENLRHVSPHVDNPLSITTSARKLSLHPCVYKGHYREHGAVTKVEAIAERVVQHHADSTGSAGTQLVFCDLSVPKKARKNEAEKMINLQASAQAGNEAAIKGLAELSPDDIIALSSPFDFYSALKESLVERGIPENEIAFIHDAHTDYKRVRLFEDVRLGRVRVLIGSTSKMGTGMNVQDRMVAMHHADPPWRPADIAQRSGRMLRQGNGNKEVSEYFYASERTYDSRAWEVLLIKQSFLEQFQSGGDVGRSTEDVTSKSATYAQMKAIASGNPLFLEQVRLEALLARLKIEKRSFLQGRYRYQLTLSKLGDWPERRDAKLAQFRATVTGRDEAVKTPWTMHVDGRAYDGAEDARREAAEAAAKEEKRAKAAIDASAVKVDPAAAVVPLPESVPQALTLKGQSPAVSADAKKKGQEKKPKIPLQRVLAATALGDAIKRMAVRAAGDRYAGLTVPKKGGGVLEDDLLCTYRGKYELRAEAHLVRARGRHNEVEDFQQLWVRILDKSTGFEHDLHSIDVDIALKFDAPGGRGLMDRVENWLNNLPEAEVNYQAIARATDKEMALAEEHVEDRFQGEADLLNASAELEKVHNELIRQEESGEMKEAAAEAVAGRKRKTSPKGGRRHLPKDPDLQQPEEEVAEIAACGL